MIFTWSAQPDGANLAFVPATDELVFDDPGLSAADLLLSATGSTTVFSYGDKSVTLLTSGYTLTTANITFADGSLLVIGDNTISTTNDGAASIVAGGAGDDLLIGGGGADTVSGGVGDDVIVVGDPVTGGAYGNDTLDGGAGNDRLVYVDDAGFGIVVNLGNGVDTVAGENYGQFTGGVAFGGDGNPGSGLTLRGIEAVTGTPHDDVFNANSASLVTGGPDDIWQRFEGRGGDDAIVGATGDGRVTVAEYGNAPSAVFVDLGAGTAADGEGGSDTLVNVDVVIGSAFDDTLTGGAGNDTLDGSRGFDSLTGGAGDDTYIVDSKGTLGTSRIVFVPDPVTETVGGGADTVWSNASYTLPDTVEHLVLTGTTSFWRAYSGIGNNLDNRIEAQGSARHILDGGGGSDTLIGGSGTDALIWDAADALVNGGAGTDTLRIDGSGVTLNLAGLSGSVFQDMEAVDLTGAGNNTLTLTLADVLAISSTDTLRVDGDAGDVVNAGSSWAVAGDQVIGSNTYHGYTQLGATLLIDTDITINLLP